jgi:putative membrane protein
MNDTKPTQSDPRVFFAAERTLLAWIRTSLSIMGIGFVIARFGLFLHLVSLQVPAALTHSNSGLSAILGIFFVFTGAVSALIASVQHRRYLATLSTTDIPLAYSHGFTSGFGIFMSLLGFGLAVYLTVSQT